MPKPLQFLSPIHKASRQIRIHLGSAMGDLELAPEEGHLLSYLRSYAPCAISELHTVFGLKRSTLTSMLDRLERRGLLRRQLHPDDRRSFLVHLSPSGRTLAEKVQVPVTELEAAIRAAVGRDDVRGFQRVMEAIGEVTGVRVKDGDA